MRLSTVLDDVHYGRLVLPEFQRGYVWGRDQVRALMTSLYRRYPVGGLLVWTAEVDPSVVRGPSAPGVVTLLLDGQQRITSLYGVIQGEPPSFFQGNHKAFTDLYFNVRTEVFEFYGPVKMAEDPFWIPVTSVFQQDLADLLEGLAPHVDDQRELLRFQTRLGHIRDIRDIELHQESISGRDRTIDEVVEIFNRVNSGGTKLSAGDLALARICADWPDARNQLRRMLDAWQDAGYGFKQEWLLRCATAIATNQASFSSLRGVSVDDFADALGRAEKSVNFLLNLIADRLGLDHDRVLAGRGSFAALVRLVSNSGGSITDHAQQQRLLFWYVHNFLWGRYSGSTETVLQRDLDAIDQGGLDGLILELNRWRGSLEVRPEDFDLWGVGARFYPMLYSLSRVGGARDLGNGMQLSAGMLGAASQLHLHHVFPKARLRDAGYSKSQINAIANMSFLTAQSNMQISASNPAEYLAQVSEQHPGVLESQWIPTDPALWSIDRYPDFLAARRRLLATATNELLADLSMGEPVGAAGGDGTFATDVVDRSGASTIVEREDDPVLTELRDLTRSLGLAEPDAHFEIVNDSTGELLAVADLAWPDGVQTGRTQPVAFLLEPDADMEARLSALGYQFFVSGDRLTTYLRGLVDGDDDPALAAIDNTALDATEDVIAERIGSAPSEYHGVLNEFVTRCRDLGCTIEAPNGLRTDYLNVYWSGDRRRRVAGFMVRQSSVGRGPRTEIYCLPELAAAHPPAEVDLHNDVPTQVKVYLGDAGAADAAIALVRAAIDEAATRP